MNNWDDGGVNDRGGGGWLDRGDFLGLLLGVLLLLWSSDLLLGWSGLDGLLDLVVDRGILLGVLLFGGSLLKCRCGFGCEGQC